MKKIIVLFLGFSLIYFITQFNIPEIMYITKALLILGIVGSIGIVFFRLITWGKPQNWLITVGGGMITGPLVFLFCLSILSYLFKGPFFLVSLFIIVALASIYIAWKKKMHLLADIFHPKITKSKETQLIFLFIALHIILFFFLADRANVGGDVFQYWAIATSFARGNYPIVLSWQPNFLAVYHVGAFMIMGLLQVVSGIVVERIHFFFAFYILTAVFLFVTGIALKKAYSLFALLPAVFGLFLIGGPILLLKTGYNIFGFNLHSFTKLIIYYPTYNMTVGSIGEGAISTDSFIYLSFVTLSIGVFALFVYILTERNKNFLLRDYLILVVLTVLNLSINDVFFPLQVFLIGVFFFYDYYKKPLVKIALNALVLLVIFVVLFFVVQNSVRDSLFTPSPQAPRFQLFIPHFNNLAGLITPIHGESVLSHNQNGLEWYLVDIRVLILLGFLLCIFTQDSVVLTFTMASLVSLLCSIFIKSTFSPWDTLRFFTVSYELIAFAFGFLMIDLLKNRKTKLMCILIIFLLLPQIISSYRNVIAIILAKNYDSYSVVEYNNPDLEMISRTVPISARILIMSFSPDGSLDLTLTGDALVKYGIFVPYGPANTKMLDIGAGSEWYDAALYLDPHALKKLGVSYLYVQGNSLSFLPKARIKDIASTSLFKKIAKTPNGVIYKVSDKYKALKDTTDPTYQKMMDIIPDNTIVYLDTIYSDIRRVMFLDLALKHETVYGRSYKNFIGSEYYTTIEIIPPKITESTRNVSNIKYAIMRPGINPSSIIFGTYQKVVDMYLATLWKRVD